MDVKDAVTLKDYINITVGTIPLREDFEELGGSSETEISSDGQIELTVASDLTSVILMPEYPDLRKILHAFFFFLSKTQLISGKT